MKTCLAIVGTLAKSARLFAVVAMCLGATSAMAANYWKGADGADLAEPENWSANALPTDAAGTFDGRSEHGADYAATLSADTSFYQFYWSASSLKTVFDLGGNTLTFTAPGGNSGKAAMRLDTNYSGVEATLTNGIVEASASRCGAWVLGDNQTLTFGEGLVFNGNAALHSGGAHSGSSIVVRDGAKVNGCLYVGSKQRNCSILVTGSASVVNYNGKTLDLDGDASYGDNSFTVSEGAVVTNAVVSLGAANCTNLAILVDNAFFYAPSNSVGTAGVSNSVNVANGGEFITEGTTTIGGSGSVSVSNGGVFNSASVSDSGSITVSGGMFTSEGTTTIGGSGSVSVSNGGVFNSASVSDSGSITVSGGMFTSEGATSIDGSGSVSVSNGGVFNSASVSDSGSITVSSGTFNSAGISTFNGGSVIVSGGAFNSAGASAVHTGGSLEVSNDGEFFSGGDVNIGNYGSGSRVVVDTGALLYTTNWNTSTDAKSFYICKNGVVGNNEIYVGDGGAITTRQFQVRGSDNTLSISNGTISAVLFSFAAGNALHFAGASPKLYERESKKLTIGANCTFLFDIPAGGYVKRDGLDNAAPCDFVPSDAITIPDDTQLVINASEYAKEGGGTVPLMAFRGNKAITFPQTLLDRWNAELAASNCSVAWDAANRQLTCTVKKPGLVIFVR